MQLEAIKRSDRLHTKAIELLRYIVNGWYLNFPLLLLFDIFPCYTCCLSHYTNTSVYRCYHATLPFAVSRSCICQICFYHATFVSAFPCFLCFLCFAVLSFPVLLPQLPLCSLFELLLPKLMCIIFPVIFKNKVLFSVTFHVCLLKLLCSQYLVCTDQTHPEHVPSPIQTYLRMPHWAVRMVGECLDHSAREQEVHTLWRMTLFQDYSVSCVSG